MRGVDTVMHLAATIRDQPGGTIEELNGLATVRLLRSAERAGAKRFVFFSAMGATGFQRTRFFRSKALAEHAVAASPLRTTVFAPSIVYRPGDPWITLLQRLSILPAMPVSGEGEALYQPIWARDVAQCVASSLNGSGPAKDADGRYRARRPGGPLLRRHRRRGAGGERADAGPSCTFRLPWCGRDCGRSSCSSAPPCSRPGRRRS